MSDTRDLVILDVDGTLVDANYLHALAWLRAFEANDHRIPTYRIHRTIGMGGDKLVEELLGAQVEEKEGDALRKAWQKEYDKLSDEAYPLPGASELIRSVHERGFLVAIASSGEKDAVEKAIKSLDVDDYIDAIVSSADVEASKPDADLVHAAIDKVSADRAVMVGDTVYDVSAAAKAGLGCVSVLTGGFGAAELRDSGAEKVLDDLTDANDLDWGALVRTPTASE